jgi:hypothetical protein
VQPIKVLAGVIERGTFHNPTYGFWWLWIKAM